MVHEAFGFIATKGKKLRRKRQIIAWWSRRIGWDR